MRFTTVLLLQMVLILSTAPSDALAQGRGGHGRGAPSDRGRVEAPRERPRATHKPAAAQERQPTESARGGPPPHSAAPAETGGVLGTMRRFFGFERSQERMADSGHEHERATAQERARIEQAPHGPTEPDE